MIFVPSSEKCHPKDKIKLNCGTSLQKWLQSIDDPNLLPFQLYNENIHPFDMNNPEIEIDIGFLLQKRFEYSLSLVIQTQRVILFEGVMVDGRLKAKVKWS